jgi:hypothetical protein
LLLNLIPFLLSLSPSGEAYDPIYKASVKQNVDLHTVFRSTNASLSGSLATVVLAQGLVEGLVEELTARMVDLEKASPQGQPPDNTAPF